MNIPIISCVHDNILVKTTKYKNPNSKLTKLIYKSVQYISFLDQFVSNRFSNKNRTKQISINLKGYDLIGKMAITGPDYHFQFKFLVWF